MFELITLKFSSALKFGRFSDNTASTTPLLQNTLAAS